MIQILRASTLFVAAVPVLVLPLVLGGVSWMQALVALTQEGAALLLGMAAGLFASTKGGSAIQVMVRAELYALTLAIVSGIGTAIIGFDLLPSRLAFPAYIAASLLFNFFLFSLAIHLSVRRLRETWQQGPEDSDQPRWVKIFSNSEFWREAFRWDKSRTMDRNPMAWLQEYSWTARLTKWGWFLLFLVADLVVMTDWESRKFLSWFPILAGSLALGVAFSAAGSFRRERQTGLLEILLVTPISARKVLTGRLWGMFSNYFPAVLALLVYWYGTRLLNSNAYGSGLFFLLFPNPLAFGSLMVVGLYVSLTKVNMLLGWLVTWLVAFVAPSFATVAFGRYARIEPAVAMIVSSALQCVLAAGVWLLLERNLRSRAFVRMVQA